MCSFLNEAEFVAVKRKLESKKKEKSAYLTTGTLEDEMDSDGEDEMFEQNFMIESTVKDEVQECLDAGMPEDTEPREVSAFDLTEDKRRPLRSIGQVALGDDGAEANCLQDGGSTGTFCTH